MSNAFNHRRARAGSECLPVRAARPARIAVADPSAMRAACALKCSSSEPFKYSGSEYLSPCRPGSRVLPGEISKQVENSRFIGSLTAKLKPKVGVSPAKDTPKEQPIRAPMRFSHGLDHLVLLSEIRPGIARVFVRRRLPSPRGGGGRYEGKGHRRALENSSMRIVDKSHYAALKMRQYSTLLGWIKSGKISPAALVQLPDSKRLGIWVERADADLAQNLDPGQQRAQAFPISVVETLSQKRGARACARRTRRVASRSACMAATWLHRSSCELEDLNWP